MAVETPGGGFGDTPSNDPTELLGKPLAPGVNSEGFDPKYTKDGTDIWAPPSKVTNV